jgi:hypothetical protein
MARTGDIVRATRVADMIVQVMKWLFSIGCIYTCTRNVHTPCPGTLAPLKPYYCFAVYALGLASSPPASLEVNDPLPKRNCRATEQVFARAMNPCVVADQASAFPTNCSRRSARESASGKNIRSHLGYHQVSKHLGASTPSSARGHRASSSLAGWPGARSLWIEPWAVSRFSHGQCHDLAMGSVTI